MRISESKLHASKYALFNKTNKKDGELLTVYTCTWAWCTSKAAETTPTFVEFQVRSTDNI